MHSSTAHCKRLGVRCLPLLLRLLLLGHERFPTHNAPWRYSPCGGRIMVTRQRTAAYSAGP